MAPAASTSNLSTAAMGTSGPNSHQTDLKQEECPDCGRLFGTRRAMLRHCKSSCKVAGAKQAFLCSSCYYTTAREDHLRRHEKTVHGPKPVRKSNFRKMNAKRQQVLDSGLAKLPGEEGEQGEGEEEAVALEALLVLNNRSASPSSSAPPPMPAALYHAQMLPGGNAATSQAGIQKGKKVARVKAGMNGLHASGPPMAGDGGGRELHYQLAQQHSGADAAQLLQFQKAYAEIMASAGNGFPGMSVPSATDTTASTSPTLLASSLASTSATTASIATPLMPLVTLPMMPYDTHATDPALLASLALPPLPALPPLLPPSAGELSTTTTQPIDPGLLYPDPFSFYSHDYGSLNNMLTQSEMDSVTNGLLLAPPLPAPSQTIAPEQTLHHPQMEPQKHMPTLLPSPPAKRRKLNASANGY